MSTMLSLLLVPPSYSPSPLPTPHLLWDSGDPLGNPPTLASQLSSGLVTSFPTESREDSQARGIDSIDKQHLVISSSLVSSSFSSCCLWLPHVLHLYQFPCSQSLPPHILSSTDPTTPTLCLSSNKSWPLWISINQKWHKELQ